MFRIQQIIDQLPPNDSRREWWAEMLNLIVDCQYDVAFERLKDHKRDTDYDHQMSIIAYTIGQVVREEECILINKEYVMHPGQMDMFIDGCDQIGNPVAIMITGDVVKEFSDELAAVADELSKNYKASH